MRQLALVLTTALVLFAAGCGGDDEESEPAADTTPSEQPAATATGQPTEPTDTAEPESGGGGAASEDEQAAIRETVVTWLLEGECDLMSDKFLEEQAFVGDNRQERCEFFENSFSKPQYGADDVITSDFEVDGDRASVLISDEISNVETTFNLVREGEGWVIDGTDL